MDALVTCGYHGTHTLQSGALGCPVTGTSGTILDAREHNERCALLHVTHCRVVDADDLAGRKVLRPVSFLTIRESVLDADVAKRSPHHDVVMPAPGAKRVEVDGFHTTIDEPTAGRPVLRDSPCWRNVIGGDGVTEEREHARPLDVGERGRFVGEVGEERRLGDVRRLWVPSVAPTFGLGGRQLLPRIRPREHVRVLPLEHLRFERLRYRLCDLFRPRPDVLQEYGLTVLAHAQWLFREVDVDPTGKGVGDHQHWRGQIVGAHVGMDPSLEVPVARQHGSYHKLVLDDRPGNRLGEWAAVAYASGAAVSHDVESQCLQVAHRAGFLEVFRHHLRTRSHAGLHPRPTLQAEFDRFPGDESGTDHHAGVRRVGATRDRGDDHRAVGDCKAISLILHLGLGADVESHRGGYRRTLTAFRCPVRVVFLGDGVPGSAGNQTGEHRLERILEFVERHTILRTSRAGNGRHHRVQIQLDDARVGGIR